ncbi:hypothetical protein BA173_00935 [Rickettsia sp. MEAM1 (Bemisia tabaci)]|uniref:hypothetical protein n=1 Tax=unclassified Rickettsia TaxID=114295 RepID=UPI0003168445|nr:MULTISPECIES: hypothetical protein [unclassified Rickettsia]ASX27496.1 hypothetical protein BA173_00935 [Rickettsia sp. MEAM1 (Bemisia tabaci)]ODA37443.1 hypothetical protein A8V34_03075 [Rickettsia sp. wq]ODA38016.1 hypothetical protein A8V33_05340 [Rickettsia sp. wb]
MQKFNSLFKSRNIFLIAIVIFTLSSFTLYNNRSDILKLFKSENKNLSQTLDTPEDIETNITEVKEEAPLLSTKTFFNYIDSLKFPEAPTATLEQKPEPKQKIYSPDYIHYLLNTNLLTYNFLQDQEYSKELTVLKSLPLPQEIKNILANLEEYNNNYLISKSERVEVIFPLNHKWLEKFVKIEKRPSSITIKEQDKSLILEKLKYLINFLYSEKFMQEFINKDV